ncbi:hypothetical protein EGS47_06360 [Acinetobacter sp. FDAARGOS_515]|nr:hypothetical protein EGS47_06360 [Acinetobacter sp. FDAARGOS_515]
MGSQYEPKRPRALYCLWDNFVAESFFNSSKKEWIKSRIYKTHVMERADVFDYIEMLCNDIRCHSYLDKMSLEAFETAST